MTDNKEFTIPSWLEGKDAETIHKRMLEQLPTDIDKTEAGFPYDFTKPTALEVAELLEFYLPETIKIMFPQFAYGEWLDLHAKNIGLTRKSPNKAYGVLSITGIPGTEIPIGFRFAAPAVGDNPAIEFTANETVYIDSKGKANVSITAVEAGIIGNIAENTIVIMSSPISGVVSITNQEHTTGGTEEENDDSLRERILEYNQNIDASFVGCDADYIRWAKEVDGVGAAFVIPEWDLDVPNSVKVVVLDANGEPANEAIVNAVYNYIMSPGDRVERKAPIGAIVTVSSPALLIVNISFKLVCEVNYNPTFVIEQFKKNLQTYYVEAKEESKVKYSRVGAVLSKTVGVGDYFDLKINGSTLNIEIKEDEYPITGEVVNNG